LRVEAQDVGLDLVEERARVGVALRRVVLAIELAELRHVGRHGVEAARARLLRAEHVQPVEIEPRRIETGYRIGGRARRGSRAHRGLAMARGLVVDAITAAQRDARRCECRHQR